LISAPGCSLSAGRAVSLPFAFCWQGLTCPTDPQDKEGFGSFKSHEENVMFIFEESRTFRSNQLINEVFTKTIKNNNLLEEDPIKKHQAINYA
jgi:hypothetical protein